MLIISKYKDYYDYLSGVWGVDPKIVLERKDVKILEKQKTNSPLYSQLTQSILTFVIGGKLIQLYYDGYEYYFGEEIKIFDKSTKWNRQEGHYIVEIGYVDGRKLKVKIVNGIKDGFSYLNEKFDCPIIFREDSWAFDNNILEKEFSKFPLLLSTPITKFVDATDVYRWISDYLSDQITKQQMQISSITNEEKILTKGFDLKTSFRPNMK